ncbi:hypothetical protein JKF63_06474 [Porcisia hertigi]|uniref:Uncharacterized protein n=1 Tax=Porcisia hertigi TaxID=2761500 RepID=A0A836LK05_9TRYP|nr:hypothetical protein JKF63_06474 [Porcisia hertigi]
MKVLHSSPVAGRLCCAAGEEVWVAKQSGGIAVFSALTGDHATDITLKGADGETPAQATHMIAVFEEMWVSTNEGRVHFYEIATHKWVDSVLIPGAERKVQVVSLSFNGHIAVIAAASGSVYIHHPLTHKRLGTLSTSLSPCTAVIQFYSFVVGGDAGGALYLWDPFTCECVIYHGESKSEVVALLHEPTTGTIWVSRANEHVDVYALHEGTLQLQHRVRGIGRVTGMVAVSGTVVATTFTKRIVQIDALTAKTTINVESAHDNFIHGCCKAMHQEVAQVWSIGNDGTLRVWNAVGLQVPAVPLPRLPPATQAALVSSMKANFELAQGDLRVEVQSERLHRLNMSEMLMKAREEAQELRLRLTGEEEKRLTIDAELAAERKHRKELEEHNAKLIKDATDMVSRFADTERECNSLRGEVTQLKVDLSKSRTEASTKQTERSDLEKQLSQERANRNVLEQRLRDAEGKLSSLQAEHRRVCDEMRSVTATHQTGRASQDILAKSTAAWCTELEHARKMNDLMRSAMASMEYTIRRREEEDRDLTSLLNAFRSRVADRVTDPNLSALLLATIARNAPRFDLQCDELTKAQLMNKNGPFLQFIQSLRAADPEAYEKLMQYLQNPSLSQALSADAQTLLDRFVTLASREGKVSGEDIASLKRAIPGFTDSAAIAQGAGVVGVVNASTPGASSAPHKGAILPIPVGVTTLQGSGAGVHGIHGGGAGPLGSAGGSLAVQNGLLGSVPLHELRGQAFTDDHYIREQQVMFEFILKTRHLLVESLAVLYKRIASARQVVEAFCLNTTAASTSTVAVSLSHKNLQPFQGIFSDVVRELEGLAFDVLQRYLTTAEKQRLGVGQ